MSIERAAMRGRLSELQDKKAQLRFKAEGLCTAIRQGLNTALTPVEEIEVAIVAQQMDDLVMAYAELQGVLSDIARLEKELR